MILQCAECPAELATENPTAWIEHLTDGGHAFHPFAIATSR